MDSRRGLAALSLICLVMTAWAAPSGAMAKAATASAGAPCSSASGPGGDLSSAALSVGSVQTVTGHAAANVAHIEGALGPGTVVGLVPAGVQNHLTYYTPEIVNVGADTVKAIPGGLTTLVGGSGIPLGVTDGLAVYQSSSTITTAYDASGDAAWVGPYGGRAAGDVLFGSGQAHGVGIVTEARTGQTLGVLATAPGFPPGGYLAQACAGHTLYLAEYGETFAHGEAGVTVGAWSLPYGEPLWSRTVEVPVQPGYVFNDSLPWPAMTLYATPTGPVVTGPPPYAGAVMLSASDGAVLWRRAGQNLRLEPGPAGDVAVEAGTGPVDVVAARTGLTVRVLTMPRGQTLVGASGQDIVLAGSGRLTVENWRGGDRHTSVGPAGTVQVFEVNGGVYAVGLRRVGSRTALGMATLAPPHPVMPYRLPVAPWHLIREVELPAGQFVGAISRNGQDAFLASGANDRLYELDPYGGTTQSLALPDEPLSMSVGDQDLAVALSGCTGTSTGPCGEKGRVLLVPLVPVYGATPLSKVATIELSTDDPNPLVASIPQTGDVAVADGAAGLLTVVNWNGRTVASIHLPVGTYTALAVTPDGTKALVSDQTSRQILAVDLVDAKALAPMPCRYGAPGAIAITPDGAYAYVDEEGSQPSGSPPIEQVTLRGDSVSNYLGVTGALGPLAVSGVYNALLVGLAAENVVDLMPTHEAMGIAGEDWLFSWLRLGPRWRGGITSVGMTWDGLQALVADQGGVSAIDVRTGSLEQALLANLPSSAGPVRVLAATRVPLAVGWAGHQAWFWSQSLPH